MTVSKHSARAVADVTAGVILASVEIAAPVDRVFRALTDSSEIVRWWGSADTYQTEEWTADMRVGGKWRARGKGADGSAFTVHGEFLEIDAPHKLVQTWQAPWDGDNVTTITYRLESIEGGTRITMKHEGFGDRRASCENHVEGWERVFGWLGGHLAATRSVYFCRLVSPRTTFMQDMTDAEKKAMMAHGAYWKDLMAKGVALLFGPVADPKGGWGMGVLRVRNAEHLAELQRNDPAIRSEIGLRYEALPMLRVVTPE